MSDIYAICSTCRLPTSWSSDASSPGPRSARAHCPPWRSPERERDEGRGRTHMPSRRCRSRTPSHRQHSRIPSPSRHHPQAPRRHHPRSSYYNDERYHNGHDCPGCPRWRSRDRGLVDQFFGTSWSSRGVAERSRLRPKAPPPSAFPLAFPPAFP